MKYWLPSSLILFICLISITHAVANKERKHFSFEDNESNVRLPQRKLNATRTLKSAKFGDYIFEDNAINRHPSLRVQNFQTRLNHFSTDDQRTVEFVRNGIFVDIVHWTTTSIM